MEYDQCRHGILLTRQDLRLSLLRVGGRSVCLLHERMLDWVASLQAVKKPARFGAMNSRRPVSRDILEARATHRDADRKHSSRRKGSPHVAPCVLADRIGRVEEVEVLPNSRGPLVLPSANHAQDCCGPRGASRGVSSSSSRRGASSS